jgi:hypothetical protein
MTCTTRGIFNQIMHLRRTIDGIVATAPTAQRLRQRDAAMYWRVASHGIVVRAAQVAAIIVSKYQQDYELCPRKNWRSAS